MMIKIKVYSKANEEYDLQCRAFPVSYAYHFSVHGRHIHLRELLYGQLLAPKKIFWSRLQGGQRGPSVAIFSIVLGQQNQWRHLQWLLARLIKC